MKDCVQRTCITVAHSSVETNFSTVLIFVQNERCTKSYENKVCTKISCYTVDRLGSKQVAHLGCVRLGLFLNW